MPRKPKRPCSYPGCPNLTEGRYCEEHQKQENQRYERYGRDRETKKRYGRQWERIRSRYIALHPLCEECYRHGRYVKAEHVHHIKPLSEGGTHDEDNLMSLCRRCHSKIHAERGDRWNRRPRGGLDLYGRPSGERARGHVFAKGNIKRVIKEAKGKMPTKSNNTGGRGGKRPGAGRKKKPTIEKAENGNPGGRKLSVLDIPDMEGSEMPSPHDFLSAEQKDGSQLQAREIYEETWNWLKQVGCASMISPQVIERYAMCSARWIQCEEVTNKLGFLSKHPTTQKPIPSPFVNIGINYMNQANRLWDEIFQVVKENCQTDYSGPNPQDDLMERLLRSRER